MYRIKITSAGFAFVVAGGWMLAQISPALAASSSCALYPNRMSCQTENVAANNSGHFIHFEVSPYMKYKVRDSANHVVVAGGTAGHLGVRKTVTGLYGSYYLVMSQPKHKIFGQGWINNN